MSESQAKIEAESTYSKSKAKLENTFRNKKLRLFTWLKDNGYNSILKSLLKCGAWFINYRCKDCKKFWHKALRCGKEYCPKCGRKNSEAHLRRYSRLWSRLMWANKDAALGYVILTIPAGLCNRFRDEKKLNEMYKLAWQTVEEVFDVFGALVTVHYFGSRSDRFAPHVNIVFPFFRGQGIFDEYGRVPVEKLDELRRVWRLKVEDLLGVEFPKKEDGEYEQAEYFEKTLGRLEYKENAWYSPKVHKAKRMHTLRYVARPVLGLSRLVRLLDKDEGLCHFLMSLRRHHTSRWYGLLSNNKHKEFFKALGIETLECEDVELDEAKTLGMGCCPACGGELEFTGLAARQEIAYELKPLGGGWFARARGP